MLIVTSVSIIIIITTTAAVHKKLFMDISEAYKR